jgi:photosynthetic reaction center cytochrome c subunit
MARVPQRAMAAKFVALALLVGPLFILCSTAGRSQSLHNGSANSQKKVNEQRLPPEPAGAARCAFCHPAEVEGYARSAMAHSLRRAGEEPEGSVSAGGSTITMHSSSNGYWQRWENSGDTTEYRADYVVGSGIHASGYLVDIGGHLFQSPVAFYKSRQAYGLAPGYENLSDPDFTRPVSEECVLCHSGRALHVPGTLNQYRSPIFSAEGITCERCHGPAEKHLADPRAGTIVNPAKLERGARDSICEQCHLFGAARVPNPGKKLSDFVPGQRLEDSYTVYHNAAPTGSPAGNFNVISHVEQLALSACSRNSEGRLWCGTCHNPHDKPEPKDSLAYYRSRCLTCHVSGFPANHPSKESDCIGCHMPRRDAKDGGHTAFTDHRIQKRAEHTSSPASTEIVAWREPSPELQKRNLAIAHIDVGMQRHSSALVVQGYRALAEVQRQFGEDPDYFKWIGSALMLGQKYEDAKFAFERLLQLDPNSSLSEANAASPYLQEGDTKTAIAHLERAVALDPLNLPASSTLIQLYQKEGKTAEATALANQMKSAMNESVVSTPGAADKAGTSNSKNAEEVYKNIKVLKGIPSGQLIPAMQFITASLGVECSFCHVEGHFEKDDKKPKETARRMMQMMSALNGSDFNNQREVTCYTCHRGARSPVDSPLVAVDEKLTNEKPKTSAQALSTGLPTVREVLDRYLRAMGGFAAIEKISSRVEKGSVELRGQRLNIEISTKSPNKRIVLQHSPDGDTVTALDGNAGWVCAPGRPVRDLHGDELESAQFAANLHSPLDIESLYPELRVEYPETINQQEVYIVVGKREGRPSARFSFDKQTGLLLRLVQLVDSPLGQLPTQIDYADYREVDGAEVPFRISISRPESTWTLQLREVLQNTPLDDAIFGRPSSACSSQKSAPHN